MIHTGSSRRRAKGHYDRQPRGLDPEAKLKALLQGERPEEACQNVQISACSGTFMNNAD